jgi:hypothetical protein
LQHDARRPSIIGNSHQLRFRPSAAELFPELQTRVHLPRAEGKSSIEISTTELPIFSRSDEADVHYIIFLRRQPMKCAALRGLSWEVALEYFTRLLYPIGEIAKSQAALLPRLAHAQVYELIYEELDQAIERLETLTGQTNLNFC